MMVTFICLFTVFSISNPNFKQTGYITKGIAGSWGFIRCLDANRDNNDDLIFSAVTRDSFSTLFYSYRQWDRYSLVDSLQWHKNRRGISWDVGYLDNDSLYDMVVKRTDPDTAPYYLIEIYEARTDTSFPKKLVWRWWYEVSGNICHPIYVTDLDQDGRKEFLFNDWYYVYIFENSGDNQYSIVFKDTVIENHVVNPFHAIGDFDGDSRLEFVFGAADGFPNRPTILVFECSGDNQYRRTFQDTIEVYNCSDALPTHDLDQDGKIEFIFQHRHVHDMMWTYVLSIWESTGNDDYSIIFKDSIGGLHPRLYRGTSGCGDVDSDGQEELVWAIANNWTIYRACGNNIFERIYTAYAHPTGNRHSYTQVYVYDLNKNGYPEIIESGEVDSPYVRTETKIWEIEGVRLHQPNGGEVLQPGSQFTITWEKFTPPGADSFSLFVSFDNGLHYSNLASLQHSNDTLFVWTVPDTLADSCRIMIWAYGPPRAGEDKPRGTAWDFSDSSFAIRQTSVGEEAMGNRQWAGLKILQNPTTKTQGVRLLATSHMPGAKLQVYDVAGKLVKSLLLGSMPATPASIVIHLNPGIYFVRLDAEGQTITKKVVVIE